MSEQPQSDYRNEVERFLQFTAETSGDARSEDLCDYLERLSVAPYLDALAHEFRSIGTDAPAWVRLEAERRNTVTQQELLRESWIELLTNLQFPDEAAASTDLTEAGLQLLQGLVASLERAGESLDSARTRAVMALHELVRHPERYREMRVQAGLTKPGDTGEEVSSDVFGAYLTTPIPWCRPESGPPSSEVLPLVPEDLFLEWRDDASPFPARVDRPADVRETPAATPTQELPPAQHGDPHDHDTWLSRNFRYPSNH